MSFLNLWNKNIKTLTHFLATGSEERDICLQVCIRLFMIGVNWHSTLLIELNVTVDILRFAEEAILLFTKIQEFVESHSTWKEKNRYFERELELNEPPKSISSERNPINTIRGSSEDHFGLDLVRKMFKIVFLPKNIFSVYLEVHPIYFRHPIFLSMILFRSNNTMMKNYLKLQTPWVNWRIGVCPGLGFQKFRIQKIKSGQTSETMSWSPSLCSF